MLKIIRSSDRKSLEKLLKRRGERLAEAEAVARRIVEAVRRRGDRALVQYARKLDGLRGASVVVEPAALAKAARELPEDFRRAVELASGHIWEYCHMQMPRGWRKRVRPGLSVGQIVRPLDSVAAYIPGGRCPLPSTLLMTVIPAQVAGVKTIAVASPSRHPLLLGTAGLLGVRNFFHMGGAQAVAAFAFGTKTVPRAERIVGPGNIYVAAAKKLLAGEVGIDFVAGPTEVLILAGDGAGRDTPRWLAADMLAQAEHDADATAILLTHSVRLAMQVTREIDWQLATLPTRKVAEKSIAANGAIVVTHTAAEAVELANRFAPEHISVPDASYLDGIHNAGSVFIGPWSPEAAGDYASGPNHVLPTGGRAALRGGLSVSDYVKVISVQELNRRGLKYLAGAITTLARAEGLEAHARSVEARLS
ncbi:MAG TPA: histidinol dehydrogenase [Bryobacterales bacterium]|nr:histidinol dehydrogenase [Bryobacterales bacterium]